MPISAIGCAAAIQAAYVFNSGSVLFPSIATGIGTAVFNWVGAAGVQCQGSCSGTAGAGATTGALLVPPGADAAIAAFATFGFKEPTSVAIATAIGNGVATHFTSAGMYVGTSAGVGAGVDISKIAITNQPALYAQLQTTLPASLGGSGYLLPSFAQAVASAICAVLLKSTPAPVPGACAGPPSPSGATGTSISVVV